jgi:hypothetical protein
MNHVPEDRLEIYLLGRLPGQQMGDTQDPEVVAIEEHLLACGFCTNLAESMEMTIAKIREVFELESLPRSIYGQKNTAGRAQ